MKTKEEIHQKMAQLRASTKKDLSVREGVTVQQIYAQIAILKWVLEEDIGLQ